jgi:hypothetical protein
MTQVVRICKYGCNAQLGEFDTKENKYRETDVSKTIHTKERCQELKNQNSLPNGNGNDLSVEVLLKRLKQLGISIDLSKLRLVK